MSENEDVKSIVFYRSFFEVTEKLDAEDYKSVLSGLFRYAFLGEEPELDGVNEMLFTLMKPQIDANKKKRKNGEKGGRPKEEE